MAITKADKRLEQVTFIFNGAGNVNGMKAVVNTAVVEDGKQLTRVRETVDIWGGLSLSERTTVNTIGKKIRAKAFA